MKSPRRAVKGWRVIALLACTPWAHAQQNSEYRVKAAFLYNFALFTEWPQATGSALNLCVVGTDPFGEELDALQGKPVGERRLAVRREPFAGSLAGCQIVFIAPSAIAGVPRLLEELNGNAVLTVADRPGAAERGVALNMLVTEHKVAFEANLPAARNAGLNLSSKLLRLAVTVIQ